MTIWGQPRKAGKVRRPEQVLAGRRVGRATGGNSVAGTPVVFGRHPIAASMAARLGWATSLTSPMARGRFRAAPDGSATRRGVDGGSPDLGGLQLFRGLVSRPTGARVGAQGGPSAQPGYPSTNGSSSVLDLLAQMRRPDQPGSGR